jgi:hypothetical protein
MVNKLEHRVLRAGWATLSVAIRPIAVRVISVYIGKLIARCALQYVSTDPNFLDGVKACLVSKFLISAVYGIELLKDQAAPYLGKCLLVRSVFQ